jgi:DHA2 family multidrug resistance protein
MTPPTGFLAGRFGNKRLFLVSVAGFTFASMLCGMAQTLVQIVLFRVLQGLFGAALVPLSQTVLFNINSKERQGSAMALWGVAVMAGPVLGPVLGGWLTEAYSWRYVFYINLPIGALAFLGMSTFLKETPRNATAKLDWFGFGTLSLAIGAMQVALDRGEQLDWFGSGEIIIETSPPLHSTCSSSIPLPRAIPSCGRRCSVTGTSPPGSCSSRSSASPTTPHWRSSPPIFSIS